MSVQHLLAKIERDCFPRLKAGTILPNLQLQMDLTPGANANGSGRLKPHSNFQIHLRELLFEQSGLVLPLIRAPNHHRLHGD